MMSCQYCNKEFKTEHRLRKHEKTICKLRNEDVGEKSVTFTRADPQARSIQQLQLENQQLKKLLEKVDKKPIRTKNKKKIISLKDDIVQMLHSQLDIESIPDDIELQLYELLFDFTTKKKCLYNPFFCFRNT